MKDIQVKVFDNDLEKAMRILIHYVFAIAMLTVYGGQV